MKTCSHGTVVIKIIATLRANLDGKVPCGQGIVCWFHLKRVPTKESPRHEEQEKD
jgi:hypothetical protein